MENYLEIGKVYRHFKGSLYIVEGEAVNSETLRDTVIYRQLYGEGKLWTRDKEDFLSPISDRTDNATGQRYRFERIDL